MKKLYNLLFILSFFAFLPVAQAAAPAPATLPGTSFSAEVSPEMTRAEQRQLRKEMRKMARETRKMQGGDSEVLEIILAILIPPLGIWLHEDAITVNFWVGLVLMLLGVTWILGSLFGLLIVLDVFSLAK